MSAAGSEVKPHPEAVEAAMRVLARYYSFSGVWLPNSTGEVTARVASSEALAAALAAHFKSGRWVRCERCDGTGEEPERGVWTEPGVPAFPEYRPCTAEGCGVNAPPGWRMEVGE